MRAKTEPIQPTGWGWGDRQTIGKERMENEEVVCVCGKVKFGGEGAEEDGKASEEILAGHPLARVSSGTFDLMDQIVDSPDSPDRVDS